MINNFKKMSMLLIFVAIVSSYSSCKKENVGASDIVSKNTDNKNISEMIVLGQKLEDPYEFDNMRMAFDILCKQGIQFPFTSISPTGNYVRVLIHSDEELESIEVDSALIWFDYPLNYEIVKGGSFYVDSTLKDASVSWQYGVIPCGYTLPSGLVVEYLYEVFIPEDQKDYDKYEEYYDMIEDLSESICDKEFKKEISTQSKKSKWTPSAHITVWDDLKETYVPLEGVRVNARRGCKTRYAITDQNGNCTFDSKFKKKVDYSIEWRRHYWRIVTTEKNKKTYLTGPNKEGKWTKTILKRDGEDYMRATIHRAALIANYKSLWTVSRPHKTNSIGFHTKLKIRYNHANNGSRIGIAQPGSSTDLKGADVVIWGKDDCGELYLTQHIFSNTLHELAHCAHSYWYKKKGNGGFSSVNQFIAESWASCVQWKVTTDYYVGCFNNRGYNGGLQDWTPELASTYYGVYTPVFIDLIDDFNQHNFYGEAPTDNINGYTLVEIQDNILGESRDLSTLTIALKNNKLHNTTDDQITYLLQKYQNLAF